jgi:hypothetical protein
MYIGCLNHLIEAQKVVALTLGADIKQLDALRYAFQEKKIDAAKELEEAMHKIGVPIKTENYER